MRRLVALLLPALLLVLLPTSVARADPPVREPLPLEDFTLVGNCDFDVFFHVVENNEFITTYFDSDGNPIRQIITGRFVVELTNLDTGESNVYQVSGPGFITFFEDGSVDFVLGGRSLLFFLPGDAPDLPLLFVNSGQVILHIDQEGNLTMEQVGNIEDVCAALS
jgi:hypothetical protein